MLIGSRNLHRTCIVNIENSMYTEADACFDNSLGLVESVDSKCSVDSPDYVRNRDTAGYTSYQGSLNSQDSETEIVKIATEIDTSLTFRNSHTVSPKMFKTTSDNIKEWLSIISSSVKTGFRTSINSKQPSGLLVGRQSKKEYYLTYLNGGPINEYFLSDEPDFDERLALRRTTIIVGQAQVSEGTGTRRASTVASNVSPNYTSLPEDISKAFQSPSKSIRSGSMYAVSYNDCSSEVLQKTTDFETAIRSSKSASTLGTYRETFSCSLGHNRSLLADDKSYEYTWSSTYLMSTYPGKDTKENATSYGVVISAGEHKVTDTKSLKETIAKKNHEQYVCSSVIKKHYKEKKQSTRMRKRLSFKSMCRRRWNIICKKTVDKWMHLIPMASESICTEADSQKALSNETGTEMIVNQRKSTAITTSLKWPPAAFLYKVLRDATAETLSVSVSKKISMHPSFASAFTSNADMTKPIPAIIYNQIGTQIAKSPFASEANWISSCAAAKKCDETTAAQTTKSLIYLGLKSVKLLSVLSSSATSTRSLVSDLTGVGTYTILDIEQSSKATMTEVTVYPVVGRIFKRETKSFTAGSFDVKGTLAKERREAFTIGPFDLTVPIKTCRSACNQYIMPMVVGEKIVKRVPFRDNTPISRIPAEYDDFRRLITVNTSLKHNPTCCPMMLPCCMRPQHSSPTLSLCPSKLAEQVANRIISHIRPKSSMKKTNACGTAMTPVRIMSFSNNTRIINASAGVNTCSCSRLRSTKSSKNACYTLRTLDLTSYSHSQKDGQNSSPTSLLFPHFQPCSCSKLPGDNGCLECCRLNKKKSIPKNTYMQRFSKERPSAGLIKDIMSNHTVETNDQLPPSDGAQENTQHTLDSTILKNEQTEKEPAITTKRSRFEDQERTLQINESFIPKREQLEKEPIADKVVHLPKQEKTDLSSSKRASTVNEPETITKNQSQLSKQEQKRTVKPTDPSILKNKTTEVEPPEKLSKNVFTSRCQLPPPQACCLDCNQTSTECLIVFEPPHCVTHQGYQRKTIYESRSREVHPKRIIQEQHGAVGRKPIPCELGQEELHLYPDTRRAQYNSKRHSHGEPDKEQSCHCCKNKAIHESCYKSRPSKTKNCPEGYPRKPKENCIQVKDRCTSKPSDPDNYLKHRATQPTESDYQYTRDRKPDANTEPCFVKEACASKQTKLEKCPKNRPTQLSDSDCQNSDQAQFDTSTDPETDDDSEEQDEDEDTTPEQLAALIADNIAKLKAHAQKACSHNRPYCAGNGVNTPTPPSCSLKSRKCSFRRRDIACQCQSADCKCQIEQCTRTVLVGSTQDMSQVCQTVFFSTKHTEAVPQTKSEATQFIETEAPAGEFATCVKYISNVLADKLARVKDNFAKTNCDDPKAFQAVFRAMCLKDLPSSQHDIVCQTPSRTRWPVLPMDTLTDHTCCGERNTCCGIQKVPRNPYAQQATYRAICEQGAPWQTEGTQQYTAFDTSSHSPGVTWRVKTRHSSPVNHAFSVTNICRGRERDNLRAVYYMLSALEGRVRRVKRSYY